MLPPKAQFVREIERGRSKSATASTPLKYHFESPSPPNSTYFASVLRRDGEDQPLVDEEKTWRHSEGAMCRKSFDVMSYRQELAVLAARRRRKYNLIAAVVVALVLMACGGMLAFVLVSSSKA